MQIEHILKMATETLAEIDRLTDRRNEAARAGREQQTVRQVANEVQAFKRATNLSLDDGEA